MENKGSFIDKIVPYIGPLLTIGSHLLLNKKINDMDAAEKKITKVLKNVESGKKVDLEKLLEERKLNDEIK